uniref:Uncharacterized protein n=1 Tax=Erpetoichthys calabaricus TaxID=27687 RepID=A0A8C4RXR3_ERPCA
MNQTLLEAVLEKCSRKLLKELEYVNEGKDLEMGNENRTLAGKKTTNPYDNAHFFILFVMFFYSFLALTVFFGYVRTKNEKSKKDPYEEFMEAGPSCKKLNPACGAVKFDFEEESIL